MVCAAALATLSIIEEDGLLANVRERETQFRELLGRTEGVKEVRGRGLLLAAVLDEPVAADLVPAALEAGLVVNNVRPDAVRLTPPLMISEDETTEAVRRFETALATLLV